MRASNRRVNRQPVRSPSPDIANRNVIAKTSAPVGQVLKKSRINSYSSKHINSITSIQQLQQAVIDWQERYKILQRQLNHLLLQNSGLKKQISHLHDLLAKNKPAFPQEQPSIEQQQQMRQYEGRIGKFLEEIKRIQELLAREKTKNQHLQGQNERLKYMQNNQKTLQYQQATLNLSFQRMKLEHETKIRQILDGLSKRIDLCQNNQTSIQSLVRSSRFRTPKANKQADDHEYSTAPGQKTYSPGDSRKFARKIVPKDEEKDSFHQDLALENSRLRLALEREKEKTVECPNCNIYLRKIKDLEQEIQKLRIQKLQDEEERDAAIKLQLQRQHESYSFNLQDYLKRIKQVKTILNNEQFHQFVLKVNQLISQNSTLASKIARSSQQTEKLHKQLRNRQIQFKMQLNAFRKQNQVLKSQVKEQDIQIAKLQELIEQNMGQRQDYQALYANDQKVQGADPKIFSRYIQEAIKKLESLESSIETTLRE